MLKSLSLSVPALILAGGVAFAASSLSTTDHWLVSDLYKAPVYDMNNHKIGQVDNLVLSADGQIKTAVVGVGGFLGVGSKDVAIPFTDLKVANESGKDQLKVDRSKDQLNQAPAWNKDQNNAG
ncbi:MAG TPA: PRC-barrel domain-containing protein [Methylovirgula sp.]|jgi:sporulation protein YlmC with PRC-barrel domain